MADAGRVHGVDFPALTTAQSDALRMALGPRVALSNPLDYHTYIWGNREAMTNCFRAMADPALAMACVVLDFPRADRCGSREWNDVLAALQASRGASTAPAMPLGLIATLSDNMPEDIARRCIAEGITPFCGIAEAMAAIAIAAAPLPATDPEAVWPPGPDPAAPALLTEAAAKAELAAFGLRIPAAIRAATPDQAAEAASRIGFPVVLKGEGYAHKTEAGAVALNLTGAALVRDAAATMPAPSRLVEEMVTGAIAEVLIGVTRDPAHGWLLTIGAGGVMAELLRDNVSLLLPVTRDQVGGALRDLRIWALLRGWRGGPAACVDAIIDAVMAVQEHVRATPGLAEIEINPLICRAHDAVAVDALIRKEMP
ncbi:acetate--CoA ligase family protein [Paracoccus sp. DMF-8]|uniref:acetate--CoA ligase family protein n=1 Tax=Paracoccus sp. DMF-8 TaxID=3019445 RepID=UPI003204FBBA